MNTDLILWFRTVYEAQTIAKAADILHMTPGALSRAMKRLEEELGTELFINSGRNIIPSESGDKFYVSSQGILKALDDAKKSLKNDLVQKELKISTFEVFSSHFMSWMISREKFDSQITVRESVPGQIEKDILNNVSDYGLTYMPVLHSELDHFPIGRMELGIFHGVIAKKSDLPFAIPTTELGVVSFQTNSLDGWPLNTPRIVQYNFQMLETALDLASRGGCKIVCPKFLVKIENERLSDKYKLILEDNKIKLPDFKIYAVKKKKDTESKDLKKICKMMRIALS